MNIKENASKIGNGILDISPRNVGKAIVSPFTWLNKKKNEHIEQSTNKANAALAETMSAALAHAMVNMNMPKEADFTVVDKEEENKETQDA